MVYNRVETLDRTFAALADPTRRGLLARLADGPGTVSHLAAPLPISLVAVGKHLTVLERAGLAAGASGRNRGLLLPHPDPGSEPLYREGVAGYRRLAEEGGVPFDLRPTALLVVAALAGDPELLNWGLRMILVARQLERVGDHSVDIAEQVGFLLTGEFREFTDASHPVDITPDAH